MKFFETSKLHTFKKSTYISLRWIGIVGQLIAVNFVYFFLNFKFNCFASNTIIFFGILSNLYLIFILICFQGFIGWYMVSSGLVERLDVSHFRLSFHLFIAFLILSLSSLGIFLEYANGGGGTLSDLCIILTSSFLKVPSSNLASKFLELIPQTSD